MPNEIDLNRLFADIARWQDVAFSDGDAISCLAHLTDEVYELETEVYALNAGLQLDGPGSKETEMTREALAGELADVIHLCIALATVVGVHLPTAVQKKFEKNQRRVFTYDPERGYAKGD